MDDQQKIDYKPPSEQPQVVQPQWQYQSGQLQPQNYNPQSPTSQSFSDTGTLANQGSLVSWSAPEFIAHEKPKSWYMLLLAFAIITSGFIYLVTREIFSVIVVLVLAMAMAVYGRARPKVLSYAIFADGFKVGAKLYPFSTFRSFSIMDDSTTIPSIQLLPQKRFMVPITVYCKANDVDAIAKILGEFLPYEHKERDIIDKFSSRIKF